MSAFVIDKGVPIPALVSRGGLRGKYPFAKMEIGESFFIPSTHPRSTRISRTVGALVSIFSRRNPAYKFTARSVNENGVEGVRVWRVAKEASK